MPEDPGGDKGMTVAEIGDALGVSRQEAYQLARRRGWAPLREGHKGYKAGRRYRTADVLAEVDRRLVQAEGQVENLRALRAELDGSRANG